MKPAPPESTSEVALLFSPGMSAALVLWAVNHAILEAHLPSSLTSVLADCIGLFALTLGAFVLVRRKWYPLVQLCAAVLFLFMRSPAADLPLDGTDAQLFWTMALVVNPRDLIALCVLPLAQAYAKRVDPVSEHDDRIWLRAGVWIGAMLLAGIAQRLPQSAEVERDPVRHAQPAPGDAGSSR